MSMVKIPVNPQIQCHIHINTALCLLSNSALNAPSWKNDVQLDDHHIGGPVHHLGSDSSISQELDSSQCSCGSGTSGLRMQSTGFAQHTSKKLSMHNLLLYPFDFYVIMQPDSFTSRRIFYVFPFTICCSCNYCVGVHITSCVIQLYITFWLYLYNHTTHCGFSCQQQILA